MKLKGRLWRGIVIFVMLTTLVLSCAPKTPVAVSDLAKVDITDLSIYKKLGTPSILGSPGWLGTLYWHDWLKYIKFTFVPGGPFDLGSDPEDDKLSRGDEKPETRVELPGYFMMGDEVTNEEYAACVASGVCTPPASGTELCDRYLAGAFANYPVVCVSWYQADNYCHWIEGRLPTEAEYEKAASGAKNLVYPWGNAEPTCDLLNMAGCEEGGAVEVGSYPEGVSPYGFHDLSGNVREWIQDWCSSDYLNISTFNPKGASQGSTKIVRGGGFNDFPENLRTASRICYAPETTHEDVGFRCVPVTEQYAPFCTTTTTQFCEDPDIPSRETPCTPGQPTTGGGGDVTLAGFGCPSNGVVRIDFDSNGNGNSGFTAIVDGDLFTCVPSSKEDIFSCTGPEQTGGTSVAITVCGGGTYATPTPVPAAFHTEDGITLAGYLKSDLLGVGKSPAQGGGGGCPDGYIWVPDPEKLGGGECVLDPDSGCPENWFVSALGTCATDQEDACPEGTTYEPKLGGCVPEDGECPPGWIMTDRKTCEPEQNDRQLCPRGYYYDKQSHCCLPIQGDNYGCDKDHYWDITYQRCMPIDGNRCGYNQVFDNYGNCITIPGTDPQTPPDGECPDDLVLTHLTSCDMPGDGHSEGKPAAGLLTRSGDVVGPDGLIIDDPENGDPDCGQNATFVGLFDNCVERDEDDCPYGYHFSANLNRCIPDDGPGSPCPPGYRYLAKADCCVPIPGFDGSRCPEDEKIALAAAAGMDTPDQTALFAATAYDPLEGGCAPSDGDDGQTPDCPPGYFATNNLACQPGTDGSQTGPTPTPVPGTASQTPLCAEYEYFDYKLGYCVPLGDDCCPPGEDYSLLLKDCLPINQDNYTHTSDDCADGYEWVDGLCLLIGRSQGGGCTTLKVNVPTCIGGCDVGYTMVDGVCVKREEPKPDPCANVSCDTKIQSQCNLNCCKWVPPGTTGGGYCTK